ncbi:hypothetical protein ACWIGM_15975 [Bosea sp. NPDC055332]
MSGEFGITREDLAAGYAATGLAGAAWAHMSGPPVDLFNRGQLA